jgi:hypothetical protein
MTQILFSKNPSSGRPGMALHRGGPENHYKNVEALEDLKAGCVHVNGALPGAKPAAAPDALVDGQATVVLGTMHAVNDSFPGGFAGPVVVTQNDNAAHIATTRFVVKGYGPYGEFVSETLVGPNGGDAALTTNASFSSVVSVAAGPFGATTGEYDIGWGVPTAIAKKALGFAVAKKHQEVDADPKDGEVFLSLDHGEIFALPEENQGLAAGAVPFVNPDGEITDDDDAANYLLPGVNVTSVEGSLVAVEVL